MSRGTCEATARLLEARLGGRSGTPSRADHEEHPLAGARLAALNMALSGMSREQTDVYLRQNLDLEVADELIDEVYALQTG